MVDNLTFYYEEFPEEGVKVATVGRGDEALWQFHDKEAEFVRDILLGNITIIGTRYIQGL